MKRVLVLAYLFPPIANSGTQRPLKFTKYLSGHGWEPIVITAANFDGHSHDHDLLREIPAGVRVIRVPMLGEKVGSVVTRTLGGSSLAKKIGHGIGWRIQQRMRYPDMYAAWRPTAVRAAMNVFKEIGFDAIYATGYPWTSLMIGCELSAATGVPVVADFRDLWSGETIFRNERLPVDVERRFERQVVESADAVVSATESMTRLMINAYPAIDPHKFSTVHNGFDTADLDLTTPPQKSGRFRIAYTGVWKNAYNPGDLYDSIDWLRRSRPDALEGVEVVTAGFTPGEAERRGLSNHITELGFVPHHEAVALMRSADVVFLSNSDPGRHWVVPGKLYEYLASGTPVLALTDPDNESARIIRTVGGGVVVSPDDPGNLYRAVLDACVHKSLTTPPRNAAALAAFERNNLTRKLAGVLDEISARIPVRATRPQLSYSASALPRLRPR